MLAWIRITVAAAMPRDLQRRLDHDAVDVRNPDTRVDSVDGKRADACHSKLVVCVLAMSSSTGLAFNESIARTIHLIRGQHVILDADVAGLYRVETKALVRAVHRNLNRFPPDFMFQLNRDEFLRCQAGTSKKGRGGRRYMPYAFTEQGVGMLASVLRSERAAQVNIKIVRAFVKMRELLATNDEFRRKLNELEEKYDKHDKQFGGVFAAIRELMKAAEHKPTLGFARDKGDDGKDRG